MISDPDDLVSEPMSVIGLILIGMMAGVAIGLSGLGGAPLLLPSLVLITSPPWIEKLANGYNKRKKEIIL